MELDWLQPSNSIKLVFFFYRRTMLPLANPPENIGNCLLQTYIGIEVKKVWWSLFYLIFLFYTLFYFMYTVFGWREIVKREVLKREKEEKSLNFYRLEWRETEERERFFMGPTPFSNLQKVARNSHISWNSTFVLFLTNCNGRRRTWVFVFY